MGYKKLVEFEKLDKTDFDLAIMNYYKEHKVMIDGVQLINLATQELFHKLAQDAHNIDKRLLKEK